MSEIIASIEIEGTSTIFSLVDKVHSKVRGIQFQTLRLELNEKGSLLITDGHSYLPCPPIEQAEWESGNDKKDCLYIQVTDIISLEHFLSRIRLKFRGIGFYSLQLFVGHSGTILISKTP